ncbi:MAG TPA: peptidoglycan DD-metalloendopeptidase family protein [Burkholderiales bacterium]|nr:peptidoglycan DD-metalloendopeptidase family protein [Burkholderiales bacterium]
MTPLSTLHMVSYRIPAALTLVLVAGCGSALTAAPVIERSPNANAAVKPATTAALPSPPQQQPVTPTPAPPQQQTVTPTPPPSPQQKPATQTPAQPASSPVPVTPPKNDKPSNSTPPQHAADEPTTKAYREGDWRPEYHTVRKGDTLYSIALDYGQDYRELAAWNNLADPALIKIDQRLRLFAPDSVGESTNPQPVALEVPLQVTVPLFSEPKARKLPYSEQALAQLKLGTPKPEALAATPSPSVAVVAKAPVVRTTTPPTPGTSQGEPPVSDARMIWEWPAQGKVLYGFGEGPIKKGVGIEGRTGQPVMAAAPGKVVYSGSGLRGYGKLIIVKHNESYLSVYAHNSQILVKEGQTVAKGQKIAEIGNTDSDRIVLHFEIRRLGKPIDPLQYLPERAS